MIITRSILNSDAINKKVEIKSLWQQLVKKKEEYHNYNETWIFLSHKHGENDILIDVISILKNHGGNIYVDWMDDSLPNSTRDTTAQKLKSKINSCNKFVLVATEAAIASKWCNWELGIGDGKKNTEQIAVFPIAENYANGFTGTEYLNLYSAIEKVDKGNYPDNSTYHVKFPNSERLDSLKSWLLKK